jgi:uncharacterized protein with FMN-binding domain
LIADVGSSPPDWLVGTPLEYPKTLDLDWPKPAPKGWNSNKNVGQYIWDRINPNNSKWQSGVKLMVHLLEKHKGDSKLTARVQDSMASMYFRFFQDYARAAYWWESTKEKEDAVLGVSIAECYFRLGSVQIADVALKKLPASVAKIKLMGDMGNVSDALKLANSVRTSQPHELYLTAGDMCRLDGQFKEAIKWYEKVLSAPAARNDEYEKRYRARANASIETIRKFELLDFSKLADGVYAGSAIGYEGSVDVAITVCVGRVEKVEITKHKEKQYYSALTDVPSQIIAKQNLKDIEATSRATITAVAVINATAEALTRSRGTNSCTEIGVDSDAGDGWQLAVAEALQ